MEKKKDGDADLGVFVLRMNLSSDSEADMEEERENKMVFGPQNEPVDKAEVLKQHEPRNDNYSPDTSSKSVEEGSNKRRRVKWGLRDEIVICSAVVDGIKCGLQGVRSAADAMQVKKSEGFWDEVNKKLEEETGKRVSRGKLISKFRDTRRKSLLSKRNGNPHYKEVFRILGEVFGSRKRKKQGLSDAIHSDTKGDAAESDSLLKGKVLFPEKRSDECMSDFHSYCQCSNSNYGIRKQQKEDGISLSKSSSILGAPRQTYDGPCLKNNGGDGRGMHENKEVSAKKSSANIKRVKEQNADIGSNRNGKVGLHGSAIGSSGKRVKWNSRDEIVIASVVRDSVNCRLHGVNSAKEVTGFRTHREFWDEVAEKLKEETGKCVSPWKFCSKFTTLKIVYLSNKKSRVQPKNKHDEELFGIFEQMFGKVRKQRSTHHGFPNSDRKREISGGTVLKKRKALKPLTTAHPSHLSTGSGLRNRNKRKKSEVNWNEGFLLGKRTPKQDDGTFLKSIGGDGRTMSRNKGFSGKKKSKNNNEGKEGHNAHVGSNGKEEVGLDSLTTGSSVKRLKWGLKNEILIASFVRDAVNCGLDGVSSTRDTIYFKSHKAFWDEVAEKLNKETGQCASASQLYTKFRNIKTKYFAEKPSHVHQRNQHNKELFGILEQMFGSDGKQRSGYHGSHGSDAKGEVSGGAIPLVDTMLSTKRKPLEPSTAVHSSHPSTGPDLRNLYEVRPVLNERFLGDQTPVQESGKDCLKNGGYDVLLGTCFSAVKSPPKDGTRAEEQNEYQKGKGKVNVDNLVPWPGVKTVKGCVNRVKLGLRDEIIIAYAVQDGINCGLDGVKSLRDAMAFCNHEGFWTEVARKVKEETGHYISRDKLFQKFKSMEDKYLATKQSNVLEFDKHDKELFNLLEQVFGNGNCGTPHSDIKGDIYGAEPFSGNEGQEKLYKQSGILAMEDEPQLEHEKAIGQDSQTCNELPFEGLSTDIASMGVQIKQPKYVESCPNVVNGSTQSVPSSSRGNPSTCEGYQTGVTFSASTDHGVENHNGMKDKERAGGKNKQLHDRINMLLNETEQDQEQRLHDMLSKSKSKSGEWKRDQLVTDDILAGSRIREDISDHQSDYAEVVKRLERKSRKLQLMQELYKIEQQEVEDHICQVKLKASSNHP